MYTIKFHCHIYTKPGLSGLLKLTIYTVSKPGGEWCSWGLDGPGALADRRYSSCAWPYVHMYSSAVLKDQRVSFKP